jgi:drug/metabolite transporter (DMT)-like permease
MTKRKARDYSGWRLCLHSSCAKMGSNVPFCAKNCKRGVGQPSRNDARQTLNRSNRRDQVVAIALVNLATLAWSTNAIIGRRLRHDVGPFTLAAGRFTVASLFFLVMLARQPAPVRRLGVDRWKILGMAITGVIGFSPSLYLALRYTTAVNATLINGLGPLITGVLAATLIGEAMSRRQLAGAVVGLVGVVTLMTGGRAALFSILDANIGDVIVLGAVSLWGLYSVLGRSVMRQRRALTATALSTIFGAPVLILAALVEIQSAPPRLHLGLLSAIVYIGIAPTIIAFSSWNAGVRRLGASGAMVFYNTLPLYGALMGFLLLGENIGWYHLVGGLLIVGGSLWAARSPSQAG